MKRNARVRQWEILIILYGLTWRQYAQGEDSFSYKYQNYEEADGRVQVLAHYARWDVALSDQIQFGLTALSDAISGASPTGTMKASPNDPLPMGTLPNEVRKSAVASVLWKYNRTWNLNVEGSYSDEPDYISRGAAITGLYNMNGENTTIRAGISTLFDTVKSSPIDDSKETIDFLIGVTQIYSADLTFTANLLVGRSSGYLGDPYKSLGLTEPAFIPGFPERIINYYENRPDSRTKGVLYLSAKYNVERLKGAIDTSYRYFRDDWDISSHTLSFNWLQRIGDHLILEPFARYYRQDAAEFYMTTLDGTGIYPDDIFPGGVPTGGTGPYYSADYRLSQLETTSFGLKAVLFVADRFTFDATIEKYDMNGLDDITPAEAYPTATIYSLGLRYDF